MLTGHVGEDAVHGKVTSQEGNYVTLDDTKYLAIWRNLRMDSMERLNVMLSGKYCDLLIGRDFSEYMNDTAIRPKLMA